jgi:hypothetical protein
MIQVFSQHQTNCVVCDKTSHGTVGQSRLNHSVANWIGASIPRIPTSIACQFDRLQFQSLSDEEIVGLDLLFTDELYAS